MKRRLFVGHSAVIGAGLSLGLKSIFPSFNSEKLDQIQQQELAKFHTQLSDNLIGFNQDRDVATIMTTPVKILTKKMKGNDFFLKYQSANNQAISINYCKGESKITIEAA